MSGTFQAFSSAAVLTGHVLERLERTYLGMFGGSWPEYLHAIRTTGTLAMEIVANTDALYHNVEHSMMVTLVGQEIIRGKMLREGRVSARDWGHYVVSLLCHDIGYVRGILPGDTDERAVIDAGGGTVELPPGASDAFLTPHHVERGKIFVRTRFAGHDAIDPETIARNIENTRFPVPSDADPRENEDYPGLVRAADLIGQMADPNYPRKLAALFYEFEETGANRRIGYQTPEDVRESYPAFYWGLVSPHIQPALRHLRATREGRQWEASLYSHIFAVEHETAL